MTPIPSPTMSMYYSPASASSSRPRSATISIAQVRHDLLRRLREDGEYARGDAVRDEARLLDPAYVPQAKLARETQRNHHRSHSASSAYVDCDGELHDPDYRVFAPPPARAGARIGRRHTISGGRAAEGPTSWRSREQQREGAEWWRRGWAPELEEDSEDEDAETRGETDAWSTRSSSPISARVGSHGGAPSILSLTTQAYSDCASVLCGPFQPFGATEEEDLEAGPSEGDSGDELAADNNDTTSGRASIKSFTRCLARMRSHSSASSCSTAARKCSCSGAILSGSLEHAVGTHCPDRNTSSSSTLLDLDWEATLSSEKKAHHGVTTAEYCVNDESTDELWDDVEDAKEPGLTRRVRAAQLQMQTRLWRARTRLTSRLHIKSHSTAN